MQFFCPTAWKICPSVGASTKAARTPGARGNESEGKVQPSGLGGSQPSLGSEICLVGLVVVSTKPLKFRP